jgi:hypothetical protein
VAKLSKEEQEAYDKLQARLDAPDDPPSSRSEGRNVDVYIDLSDEAAVERALGLGLLTRQDVEEPPPDDGNPPPDDEPDRKDSRY